MKKINVSFKDSELHLYDYLKTKRSVSNYIKDLIEADLRKNDYLGMMKRYEDEFGELLPIRKEKE